MSEAFGRQVVLSILAEFLDAWPGLAAEISITERGADMVEEGFDLAIRFGEPVASPNLISRVVARSTAQLCASPGYLAHCGNPTSLDDLASHRLLLFGSRLSPRLWTLNTSDASTIEVPVHAIVIGDNAGALRDAALRGLGIACLPRFLSDDDVSKGNLIVV